MAVVASSVLSGMPDQSPASLHGMAGSEHVMLRKASYIHVSDLISVYDVDLNLLEQEWRRIRNRHSDPAPSDPAIGASDAPASGDAPSAEQASIDNNKSRIDNAEPAFFDNDTDGQLKRLHPPSKGFNLCVNVGKVSVVVDKERVDRSRIRLAEVEVADETGTVALRARDEQIDLLSDISDRSGAVVLRNCTIELYRGRYIRLAITKWGKFTPYPDNVASTPPPPTTVNRIRDFSKIDLNVVVRKKEDPTSRAALGAEPFAVGMDVPHMHSVNRQYQHQEQPQQQYYRQLPAQPTYHAAQQRHAYGGKYGHIRGYSQPGRHGVGASSQKHGHGRKHHGSGDGRGKRGGNRHRQTGSGSSSRKNAAMRPYGVNMMDSRTGTADGMAGSTNPAVTSMQQSPYQIMPGFAPSAVAANAQMDSSGQYMYPYSHFQVSPSGGHPSGHPQQHSRSVVSPMTEQRSHPHQSMYLPTHAQQVIMQQQYELQMGYHHQMFQQEQQRQQQQQQQQEQLQQQQMMHHQAYTDRSGDLS